MSSTTRLMPFTSFTIRDEMAPGGRAAAAPSRRSCRPCSPPPGSQSCIRRSARRPSRRRSARAAAPRTTATAADTIPRCFTSSATMWSARRIRASREGVTSPRMRTARPGPGTVVARRTRLRDPARAEHADFVLEQLAQRLDELETHPLGKAADVVVALDHVRRADHRNALDHVRIQRALRQEVERSELGGFRLEDIDEGRADDFPLLLRVGDAGQPLQKQLRGVGEHERQLQPFEPRLESAPLRLGA